MIGKDASPVFSQGIFPWQGAKTWLSRLLYNTRRENEVSRLFLADFLGWRASGAGLRILWGLGGVLRILWGLGGV